MYRLFEKKAAVEQATDESLCISLTFYLASPGKVGSHQEIMDLLSSNPVTTANICLERGLTELPVYSVGEAVTSINKVMEVLFISPQVVTKLQRTKAINVSRSHVCCEMYLRKGDSLLKKLSSLPKISSMFMIEAAGMDNMRVAYCMDEIQFVRSFQKTLLRALDLRLKAKKLDGNIEDEVIWRARGCFRPHNNLDFIFNASAADEQLLKDAFECLQVVGAY